MSVIDRLKALRDLAPSRGETSGGAGDDPFVADLQTALSPDRVRYDGAHRSLHSHDASVFEGGNAGPVCYPTSTAEVQAIVRLASDHGRNVVPRGAGTGLAGGAIPLGVPVVVALTRMNRIALSRGAMAIASERTSDTARRSRENRPLRLNPPSCHFRLLRAIILRTSLFPLIDLGRRGTLPLDNIWRPKFKSYRQVPEFHFSRSSPLLSI